MGNDIRSQSAPTQLRLPASSNQRSKAFFHPSAQFRHLLLTLTIAGFPSANISIHKSSESVEYIFRHNDEVSSCRRHFRDWRYRAHARQTNCQSVDFLHRSTSVIFHFFLSSIFFLWLLHRRRFFLPPYVPRDLPSDHARDNSSPVRSRLAFVMLSIGVLVTDFYAH